MSSQEDEQPRMRPQARRTSPTEPHSREASRAPNVEDLPPGDPEVKGRAVCFNNTSMMLTYKTHLPKAEYKDWFANIICPLYGGENCKVEFLELAHETGDSQCPYLHTHVVFQVSKRYPLKTRKQHALDWCWMNDDPIHPNWTYINTKVHMKRAKRYLAKEDPENVHLKDKTMNYIDVIQNSKCVGEAAQKLETPMAQIMQLKCAWTIFQIAEDEEPEISVDHLLRWQKEVYTKINLNSMPLPKPSPLKDSAVKGKPGERVPLPGAASHFDRRNRIIHLVVDPKGGAGKTALIKALAHSDKKRFLACQGVPTTRDFATQVQIAQEQGWNGDTILFNLTREQVDWKVMGTVEAAIDGFLTSTKYEGKTVMFNCKNVWIFSNDMPRLKSVSLDRWKIFHVHGETYHPPPKDGEDEKNYLSWLEPMTIAEALVIYKEQKLKKELRKHKERYGRIAPK